MELEAPSVDRENSAQGDVGATCVSRVRESGWPLPLPRREGKHIYYELTDDGRALADLIRRMI